MQKDIRTRSKYYFSDFADGYTVNTILKTWHSRGSLRRRLIVFISLLGPTIIFAVLLGQYSHMNIGIVETLVRGDCLHRVGVPGRAADDSDGPHGSHRDLHRRAV